MKLYRLPSLVSVAFALLIHCIVLSGPSSAKLCWQDTDCRTNSYCNAYCAPEDDGDGMGVCTHICVHVLYAFVYVCVCVCACVCVRVAFVHK